MKKGMSESAWCWVVGWIAEEQHDEVFGVYLVAVRYLDTGFVEITKCNEFLIDFKYVLILENA